ncbi:MAG: YihY/virulence factor BrkB family protein [Treponema sp.]|nr:YihY/virulence factor BrkB family protein [Treponema sp.]
MENNSFYRKRDGVKNFFLLILQRLWLTLELFNKNGLMNHAAACAYGFLLSAAPALLFISFVVSRILSVPPEVLESMLGQIDFLFGVFDAKNLVINFLSFSNSGVAGLISVLVIFWATRLCALSIQRGLGVVFSGARSILKDNIFTLGLGLLAMFVIIIALIGLRAGIILLNSVEFMSDIAIAPVLIIAARIFFMFSLALLAMAAYRFYPVRHPRFKYIVVGVLACIILYQIFAAGFAMIISPDRYNLLYGTLGRLFLFLVNIYFFFVFFFFGGQLINILDFSDAMLFIRLRQVYSEGSQPKTLFDKLFATLTKPLKKYHMLYKKGDPIFTINSQGKEVYYILSGKAGVYLDNEFKNRISVVNEHNFFGEMASITLDERAASIKAETDISVLILPPALFSVILHLDPKIDQSLIKILSQQIKTINQQMQSN